MVIAYNSVTMVNYEDQVDIKKMEAMITDCYAKRNASKVKREQNLWNVPVCYDLEFGIDLQEVSKTLGLTIDELVKQHTSHEYIVYGIGFLPGFMYLGGLPSSLEIPRRAEPRLAVAKGSVGLAGKQTGVYPQDSPGGWNIIGSCPIPLFNPKLQNPCFVKVGDKVQFHAISRAEYDLHKIEGEVGIYKPEKVVLNA